MSPSSRSESPFAARSDRNSSVNRCLGSWLRPVITRLGGIAPSVPSTPIAVEFVELTLPGDEEPLVNGVPPP
ncbi:hypothetical protein ACE1SV_32420 [Streptomyces sennicomposti]